MAYQKTKVKARQFVTPTQQMQTLGVVTNVPMGEWNATTQYLKLNIVRSNGASYQAKKNNVGVEPTVTSGWQEVWQVVAYDGGAVEPTGTYHDMTVGNATNAQNDGSGNNIAEQFDSINEKIPSTASAENQLADKAFVNSSINNSAAFYITYNADGDAFPTRAALLAATTFYSGGKPRVPTQNDYATVLADETQTVGANGNYPTTRYTYQTDTQNGTYPDGQWDFQYVVNNTTLTQAQLDAINSGITSELVEQIGKGNVLSVNGQTGAVTITPANIGAVAYDTTQDLSFTQKQKARQNIYAGYTYLSPQTVRSGTGWYRIVKLREYSTIRLSLMTNYNYNEAGKEAIIEIVYGHSSNVVTAQCMTLLATSTGSSKLFQEVRLSKDGYIDVYYVADNSGGNNRNYPLSYAIEVRNNQPVRSDGVVVSYYDWELQTTIPSAYITLDLSTNGVNTTGGIYESGQRVYSPTNLPSRLNVLDTRNNSVLDTTTFPNKKLTPFFSNKEMPTSNWWAGIDVQGWNSDVSGDQYNAWQLVGIASNDNVTDPTLYHRLINRGRSEVGNWKALLSIDPAKLMPSTANGWTIGNNTLNLPSDGLYLVSLESSAPVICIVASGTSLFIAPTTVGTTVQALYNSGISTRWSATNIRTGASVSITSVAYKKLA